MRIFNPDPAILQALGGSEIEVVVGVVNNDIPALGKNPAAAKEWVQTNILAHSNVKFKYIGVGNEISPLDGVLGPFVGPAIENIQTAVSAAGLGIKVSTVLSQEILGESYPPSKATFRSDAGPFLNPIINLLKKYNSPFLVNIYPYFAYSSDPQHIRLDYALFNSTTLVHDGTYTYQNMFDAILDAVYVSLEKAGAPNVRVVVTESGWPSSGGTSTTIDTARAYNSVLISHVTAGTPRRIGPIETYVFDLFDEDQKSPEIEKHWGLFLPNKQQKYPFTF